LVEAQLQAPAEHAVVEDRTPEQVENIGRG
jgi:hypothetical protein